MTRNNMFYSYSKYLPLKSFIFLKCVRMQDVYFLIIQFCFGIIFQVIRWPSAGVPQKRSSACDLLPFVAMARSSVTP